MPQDPDAHSPFRAGVIVVTGGTSGIGRAIVDLVLAEGMAVVALDVNGQMLAQCTASFEGTGASIRFMQVDVADDAAVAAAIETIEQDVGPICGLVNSAGIGRDIPFLETDTQSFRRIIEVNLLGSFIVARQVAMRMVGRGGGSIVNVASVSGIMGNAGRVAYGASKGAVIAMTKVMAVELAPLGVRVNALAPGPVETPLVKEMHSKAVREAWIEAVPQGRYGTAEEIATVAMFLLRDEQSSYITGQTICADGGFTALGLRPAATPAQ